MSAVRALEGQEFRQLPAHHADERDGQSWVTVS